jgi:hypothetical protein
MVQENDLPWPNPERQHNGSGHGQMDCRASLGDPGVDSMAEGQLAAMMASMDRWSFLRKYSAEWKHEMLRDSLNTPSH